VKPGTQLIDHPVGQKAALTGPAVGNPHPHRHTSIAQHAVARAKNFQPQPLGKRIGEYLETQVRDPANYRKRQRIFGFEI